MRNRVSTSESQTSSKHDDDHKLVSSVVYLSSLASELKEIDPALDTLRRITAAWDSTKPLSNEDRTDLTNLITHLKTYLIHDDPLRNFTAEQLDDRLANGLTKKHKKAMGFTWIILSCIFVSGLIFALPQFSLQNKAYLSVSVYLQLITLTNIILYVSSLRNFKPELRTVFLYLCLGSFLIGADLVTYPAIGLLKQSNTPLFEYGGITIGATLGLLSLYIGLVKYATILKLATHKTTIQTMIAAGLVIVIGVATALLRKPQNELLFGASVISVLGIGAFAFYSAKVTKQILHLLTPAYAKSLRAILPFFILSSWCATAFTIVMIIIGQLSGGPLTASLGFFAAPPLTIFLYSGYVFKKETSK